jgi:very-short-patch-repair endonuclease
MLDRVPRPAVVPPELTRGPFTVAEARRAGLARWHLEGASWRRLGPRMYVWAGLPETPELRLEAARPRLPPTAVFSGLTAAWVHGLDVAACEPIEVTIPKGMGISARSGMVVRRAVLAVGDVVKRRGMRVTSILRTLNDLCVQLSATEAVVVVDMALHADLVSLADLNALCLARARCVGVANLRRVVSLAEPAAESPMETRLRMVLVLGGLPRPQAQVPLHDSQGRFLGRPDLYYPDHRLGLEYDGRVHRGSLAEDNRRQNRLLGAGIRLLRFTAGDVLQNPDLVTTQVRTMLASRPIFHSGAGTRGFARDPKPAGAGTRGRQAMRFRTAIIGPV